jgi:8-O-methyltransferase
VDGLTHGRPETVMNTVKESDNPMSVTEPLDDPFDILLVGWSFMRGNLLMSALEFGLFQELGKDPGTAEQLTRRLELNERGARDFLDALAAMGVLERDDKGVYRNGPAADRCLIPGRPGFIGGFVAMTMQFMGAGAGSGPESLSAMLRTGNPRGLRAGKVPFSEIFDDPLRLEQFLLAMDSMTASIGPALAQRFDWSKYTSFMDVGGARGNLAATLLREHPHLKGGVFDRPFMKPLLEELAQERGVSDRLAFHDGDFFVTDIPGADVVILGNVLHDHSVGSRRKLIARVAEKIPPGGALLVYDPMLDEERRVVDNLLISLAMMVQSPAGSEHTPAECRGWMEEAGLRVEEVFPLPAHTTAVVGRKLA